MTFLTLSNSERDTESSGRATLVGSARRTVSPVPNRGDGPPSGPYNGWWIRAIRYDCLSGGFKGRREIRINCHEIQWQAIPGGDYPAPKSCQSRIAVLHPATLRLPPSAF